MARLTGSRMMTFRADAADESAYRLILRNMGNIETRQEIKTSIKNSGKKYKEEGRKNLTTYKFKYSRLKKTRKQTGFRFNSPGRKTGNLYYSIKDKFSIKKTSVDYYEGFKRGKGGGNHAHLIDRGTNERWTKPQKQKPYTDSLGRFYKNGRLYPKGRYTGSVSANHNAKQGDTFWTRAISHLGPIAQKDLNKAIDNALTKIISRV